MSHQSFDAMGPIVILTKQLSNCLGNDGLRRCSCQHILESAHAFLSTFWWNTGEYLLRQGFQSFFAIWGESILRTTLRCELTALCARGIASVLSMQTSRHSLEAAAANTWCAFLAYFS